MIIEKEILPFFDWLLGPGAVDVTQGALFVWLAAIATLLVVAVVLGLLVTIVRHGFGGFPRAFASGARRAFENVVGFSFRRSWAIARLVIKESIRRRVLLVFLLFVVVLLFAGWYIDPNSKEPAKVYLTFVLSASAILILLLSLFLSSFSLPTDFKEKTIYTVVTKPVRSSELIFGRVLGVGLVGTVLLFCMGAASYLFVTSGLQHSHILLKEDLQAVEVEGESGADADNPKRVVQRGETQLNNGHKHPVAIHADGTISVESVNGHTHQIELITTGDKSRYIVHNEQGTMEARVPLYGRLGFRGKDGLDTDKGINVGHEWEYRSYVGGNSRFSDSPNEEAAIFVFDNLKESQFPKERFPHGVPVEMSLGVFRTHKGDIEKHVTCSLALRNPKTGLRVEVLTFPTEEFITKTVVVPWTFDGTPQLIQRKGVDKDQRYYARPSDETITSEQELAQFTTRREFDFYKDFVADGQVEIWLQCVDNMQYIGVARADLYLRADEHSVAMNFVKGYFGIWMEMIVITLFGVLFSTFLSGPVAMISTVGVMIAGFSKAFMIEIGLNKVLGGGPFESLYRLLIQQNMVVDLPNTFSTTFIKSSDYVFGFFMRLCGQAIPSLSDYEIYQKAVVHGFDIPGAWLLNHGVMTLSFALPVFLVAYLILSNREVAK